MYAKILEHKFFISVFLEYSIVFFHIGSDHFTHTDFHTKAKTTLQKKKIF